MVIFLDELNNFQMCVGDVGNAYLEAYTNESIFFTAVNEFEFMGHNGHTMLINNALCGLKTIGEQWREKFSETFHKLVFSP